MAQDFFFLSFFCKSHSQKRERSPTKRFKEQNNVKMKNGHTEWGIVTKKKKKKKKRGGGGGEMKWIRALNKP